MRDNLMTIGRLAAAAGVNVETVRYYQRIKLMPVPNKQPSGIHRYGEAALQRLTFVRTAQALGFSLQEIADLVKLDDGAHCAEARKIASHKLISVRERLRNLHRIEKVLTRLVRSCETGKGTVRCPLIGALRKEGPSKLKETR